jgi:dolichyl-phosphate-mannose--protein O-mannosyl transferase
MGVSNIDCCFRLVPALAGSLLTPLTYTIMRVSNIDCCFRLVPALAGSLLTPLTYSIMIELGLSSWAGAMAGFMILFGTHTMQ